MVVALDARREYEPLIPNGDAHHSAVKVRREPRMCRRLVWKERGARIPQMFLTISDEDKPAGPNGPHFRVFVILPECIKRLVRFLIRRRVR
jgi:hypothetical protein